MNSPLLSIVVPCKSESDPQLKEFLSSVKRQSMSSDFYEVILVTEGNSEQAKAIGISRVRGTVLGFFCSDNYLRDPDFLSAMFWYAAQPGFTGAYTAQYDYVREDKPLSRYFALIGANDPLCWWLGKSDRASYLSDPEIGVKTFPLGIPSVGDNGFFVKRSALDKVRIDKDTHFPMDLCEDLRRVGEFTYYVVPTEKLWHKSGENFINYFRRRYVYTRDLYFRQKSRRRWHMVGVQDWPSVLVFSMLSVFFLPNLWLSFKGYRKVRDWAWFLHAPVCFVLTVLYGICFIRWGLKSLLLSVPLTERNLLTGASRA